MPIISIKSKILQADLGVKTVRSAKRKLLDLGVKIQGEFVLKDEVKEAFLRLSNDKKQKSVSYLKGSSFEDLSD
ncbi:hypothetical protein [Ekhidna sp.]|uniref:hypothetical protein n=1 Tax=Ekhidna sp. TaxID=2608089 RepID=UPI003B5BD845